MLSPAVTQSLNQYFNGLDVQKENYVPVTIQNDAMNSPLVKESGTLKAIQDYFPFVYRINDGISTNTILMSVCKERGWKEFTEEDLRTVGGDIIGWNLWWRCSVVNRNPRHQVLYSWQYTNHIPNAFSFCRKSCLTVYLRNMKQVHGAIYDFYPSSFVLPNEYPQFLAEHCRRADKDFPDARNISRSPGGDANYGTTRIVRTPIWISKPNGKSQGRGIFIFSDIKLLQYTSPSVLQEYITRPLLIGGYKFDLRLYVCVASNNPLNIYFYNEGLARFATAKYNLDDITCTFSHLTNSSLNKYGPGYSEDKQDIGLGCKWSLQQLRKYFANNEKISSDWYLWQKIVSIIILTVVGEAARASMYLNKRNCFNVFGFDILIDEELNPWLLEVNLSPGLGGDCLVDEQVKRPMLHDLFNLLGFPDCSEFVQMVDRNESSKPVKPKGAKNCQKPATTCTDVRPATFCTFSSKENKMKKGPVKLWTRKNEIFESLNLESTSSRMIERLMSLQKIYGKHLSLDGKSNYNLKGKDNSATKSTSKKNQNSVVKSDIFGAFSPDFWNTMIPGVQKDVSLMPHRPGIGIRHRNWNEAVKRQGGWIRIFPFNLQNENERGFSSINVKDVVTKTNFFIRSAQEVVTKFPNQTDEFYNKYLQRTCRFNTEIWLPPK